MDIVLAHSWATLTKMGKWLQVMSKNLMLKMFQDQEFSDTNSAIFLLRVIAQIKFETMT